MNPSANNPYPRGTPDHDAWNRWHQAFFRQPVSGQLYDIAAQLRSSVATLIEASAELMPPEGRRTLRMHVYSLEAIANLVHEAAQHADGHPPLADLFPD